MDNTASPSDERGSFTDQLRALAGGIEIIKVLVLHKPTPVPVSVVASELGTKRSTASMRLARLRGARLVGMQTRRKGYFADTAQIKSVVGIENYTSFIQGLHGKNEDTPGQSQG